MSVSVDDWDGSGQLPVLYSRTATGAVNIWQCWVENDEVCVQWGQWGGAQQSSRFRCLPKNEGRSNATTAYDQAVKEAISKWKKQKKKKYSESLETAGETARIKPMLALDWSGKKGKIDYPVTMQPKLDGVRCLAFWKDNDVYLQSRGGDHILLPHIQNELRSAMGGRDFVFDGELYLHGTSLQTIISLVKRPRPESGQLYYCIYDMFNLNVRRDAPWEERKQWILVWFGDHQANFNKVWMLPNNMAASEDDVKYFHTSYVEQGYEGGIIRTRTGTYREGYRSPDLLKVKAWQDAEFVITGWTVGKGKFENAPIFTCVTKEGRNFEVVPKGTQEERYAMLQQATSLVGKLLTVEFLDFTDDGKPRCARGKAIRDKGDMS